MNNGVNMINFVLPKKENSCIIKVIGVGGGGGNAVNHMYEQGIKDVSFVLCNTDYQALQKSNVPIKIQLGKVGLGAGNKPHKAEEAALESMDQITAMLKDNTKMVFITAGMGGGTGTGAAPIIAKAAKSAGILTVGIVTIPFIFEGENKIFQALEGVERMHQHVDALLVINNERLCEIYSDLTLKNAFEKADDTLTTAAKSIAEIITTQGEMNIDFADVETTLKEGGAAIMSTGFASGEERVTRAIENSLHSPLLNNNDIFGSKKILFNLYCSSSAPIRMEEVKQVNEFMRKFENKIDVIWGWAFDESLDQEVKITLLATGFSISQVSNDHKKLVIKRAFVEPEAEVDNEELAKQKAIEAKASLLERYYRGGGALNGKTSDPVLLTLEQLDDDKIIDFLDKNPAIERESAEITKLGLTFIKKK